MMRAEIRILKRNRVTSAQFLDTRLNQGAVVINLNIKFKEKRLIENLRLFIVRNQISLILQMHQIVDKTVKMLFLWYVLIQRVPAGHKCLGISNLFYLMPFSKPKFRKLCNIVVVTKCQICNIQMESKLNNLKYHESAVQQTETHIPQEQVVAKDHSLYRVKKYENLQFRNFHKLTTLFIARNTKTQQFQVELQARVVISQVQ